MISRWHISRPQGCSLHLIFSQPFKFTHRYSPARPQRKRLGFAGFLHLTEPAHGCKGDQKKSAAMYDYCIYARPCATVRSLDLGQLQCCGMFEITFALYVPAPWLVVTLAELQTALERPGLNVTWLWWVQRSWAVQSDGSMVEAHTWCLSCTTCPHFFLWGR